MKCVHYELQYEKDVDRWICIECGNEYEIKQVKT